VIALVAYAPGKQKISQFQLLPNGLPDLDEIRKAIRTLNSVLADEKAARSDDRHLRFDNQQFIAALHKEWQARGGLGGEQAVQ